MTKDWFRCSTWTAADAGEFERRLARARPGGRPQYLRIQAWHLADAGLHIPALELLERVVASPGAGIELAQAHCQRGDSLAALDRIPQAVAAYRDALEAERLRPSVHTRARFRLPLLIATRSLGEQFELALQVVKDAGAQASPMPVDVYELAAARALILDAMGLRAEARVEAGTALGAAGATSSGFRWHRDVGLVRHPDRLEDTLRRIAG